MQGQLVLVHQRKLLTQIHASIYGGDSPSFLTKCRGWVYGKKLVKTLVHRYLQTSAWALWWPAAWSVQSVWKSRLLLALRMSARNAWNFLERLVIFWNWPWNSFWRSLSSAHEASQQCLYKFSCKRIAGKWSSIACPLTDAPKATVLPCMQGWHQTLHWWLCSCLEAYVLRPFICPPMSGRNLRILIHALCIQQLGDLIAFGFHEWVNLIQQLKKYLKQFGLAQLSHLNVVHNAIMSSVTCL